MRRENAVKAEKRELKRRTIRRSTKEVKQEDHKLRCRINELQLLVNEADEKLAEYAAVEAQVRKELNQYKKRNANLNKGVDQACEKVFGMMQEKAELQIELQHKNAEIKYLRKVLKYQKAPWWKKILQRNPEKGSVINA